MGFHYLKKSMKDLTYPGNQHFHVHRLEPLNEETEKRLELAKINMPELLEGGDSLLDIGSNKGFVSVMYRDLFKKIVGYEPMISYLNFSLHLKAYHNISNVNFFYGGFREILFDKSEKEKYTTVYVGGVHHHFYKDAIASECENPFLYLKKLAGLCEKYLILDGPFDCKYHTVRRFSEDGKWTDAQKADFNLNKHVEILKPQFELVRVLPNEKGRHTAVFKRVKEDILHVEINVAELQKELEDKGQVIKANKLRDTQSVFKYNNERYKLDVRPQSDGVFLVLNSLPKYFPKTLKVLVDEKGKVQGDITEWIEGKEVPECKKLFPHWLKMNNELASVGLMELHFKMCDYLETGNKILDVDVDMIRQLEMVGKAYFNKYIGARKEQGFEVEKFEHLIKNIKKPAIFNEVLKKL